MRETEIDGVQTLLVPANGPVRAGLTFRVGLADETLPYAGITHLVAHLATTGQGPHDHPDSDTVTTSFAVEGPAEDVVSFVHNVCGCLTDLPVALLDTEKSVLRAERAGRSRGAAGELAPWRYGARTYGLLGFGEFGLDRLTEDEVRDWAATWFTRENAVLWLAADEVPSGLRLRLASGTRRPPPQAFPIPRPGPAYCTGDVQGVALDALVRRGLPATVYTAILGRELFQRLRLTDGVSYEAEAWFDPRDGGYGTILALADAVEHREEAVLDGLLDVLNRHRDGHLDQAVLDRCRAGFVDDLDHPDRAAAMLPRAAFNALVGFPNRTVEEQRDRLAALTLDDVHRVAVEAAGSALLMLPAGSDAEPDGFEYAHAHSADAVSGRRFRSLTGDGRTLVVGDDGVSLVVDEELTITVPYAECEGMLCWPNGRRRLFHASADNIPVEPDGYESGAEAVAAIDAGVPPAVRIPMRAQPPRARRPGQRLTASGAARLAGVGVFGAAMLAAGLLRPHDRWLYVTGGGALVLLSAYGFWWWARR